VARPVAKSGAETEAQRQRVNADRATVQKIMTSGQGSARMPQPDKGFFWDGTFWGGTGGRCRALPR